MDLFHELSGKVVGQWKGNKVKLIDAATFNPNEIGVTVIREKNKLFLVRGGTVIANVAADGTVMELTRPYPYTWKPEVKVNEPETVKDFSFGDYTAEVDDFFKRLADYDPFKAVGE